jgi:hypothetical protein
MQELRLVAVSEDGTYAVLLAPGQSGRFALPIDDRLRIVARGQFSRLAQYEIEVERPLRPKEIQDRIRAGETAEEIADAAGVSIDRVRRFEGPVLAERAYRAQEAQGATIRQPGDSGPGRALGEVVTERLAALRADADSVEWDSRKRADGNWQVDLTFTVNGQARFAEWTFDPRRRHVSPADDTATVLSLPGAELPEAPRLTAAGTATVTPIARRLPAPGQPPSRTGNWTPRTEANGTGVRVPSPDPAQRSHAEPATAASRSGMAQDPPPDAPPTAQPAREQPPRKAVRGRSRRSSVPTWDEIMFGTSRQSDEA